MSNPTSTPFGPFRDPQPEYINNDGNVHDSPSPVFVSTAMASLEATALATQAAPPAASSSWPTVPTLSPDISTLISWITKIKMPMSGAPMPSTVDAPKLKG